MRYYWYSICKLSHITQAGASTAKNPQSPGTRFEVHCLQLCLVECFGHLKIGLLFCGGTWACLKGDWICIQKGPPKTWSVQSADTRNLPRACGTALGQSTTSFAKVICPHAVIHAPQESFGLSHTDLEHAWSIVAMYHDRFTLHWNLSHGFTCYILLKAAPFPSLSEGLWLGIFIFEGNSWHWHDPLQYDLLHIDFLKSFHCLSEMSFTWSHQDLWDGKEFNTHS